MRIQEKLSYFHASILIFMIQTGVVLFSLPQLLAQQFGTNGWIMLFFFGAIAQANIYLISLVYRLGQGRSLFEIVEQSVPKFILYPLYVALVSIWALLGCLVTKEYVLIFQMVAFPTTSPMVFKLIVDILVYGLLIKGIYNISKAATVFFWLVVWMNLLIFFLYEEFNWSRLTPFFLQGGDNTVKGYFQVYSAFLGYELSLLLFPYSDKKTKLMKAATWGNMILCVTYAYLCLIVFGFLGAEQLKVMLFPVLDILAYIKFPFVERIENLFYGFFLFTVMITTVMYTWSANEVGIRLIPKMKENVMGFLIIGLVYLVSFIPDILSKVQHWLNVLSMIEMGIAFGLPILAIFILLLQKSKGELPDG
ncbi:GerAB/ArcD/ProY family transporter [Paenibacillus vulneris]|uniref:GerAB/ArcD/ProY family transporter n=1 Tax=Paenibacillus vulneris TaxID=1133364 RepID=A0ABW3UKI9_9BACL